jgi:hypothetical protein
MNNLAAEQRGIRCHAGPRFKPGADSDPESSVFRNL